MPVVFRYLTICVLLAIPTALFAQKEASNWYFGWHAGLDFNSGTPQPVHGGQTYTLEGVASISDKRGNLLFYTDGVTVWNRAHVAMPNGSGLHGFISSTQSAIITPVIGDTSRYYVFTIDDYGSPQRLQYSIVNMNMDGGLGDIESKNIHIISGVSEKLTAVRHCNQRDIWIITHSTFSNNYYSFLVGPGGVNTTPVISTTGTSLLGGSIGYLKASPDGHKLAAANWTLNADISDFDNVSGVVSNTFGLLPNVADTSFRTYGVEFSPNGKLLYLTTDFYVPLRAIGNLLFQFDVSLPSAAEIKASRQIVGKQLNLVNFGGLQMAIDGKMYMAKADQKEIAVINHPNTPGPGCDFVSSAVQFPVPFERSMHGLPNFIQSYFFKRDSFSYDIDCPGNKFTFHSKATVTHESLVWDFGDPTSGSNNRSTQDNPTHIYSGPGQYKVQLIINTPCGSDTLHQDIQSKALNLDLGIDTLICDGKSLELIANDGNGVYQYRWQDGNSHSTYMVTSSGDYHVEIKNEIGCTLRDSIHIDFDRIPEFSLGPDNYICPGQHLHLKPQLDPSWDLQWNDGSKDSLFTISQTGLYSLNASNGCGSSKDELVIREGLCKVYVPSAFTPNGDGKNDQFQILGSENLSSMHLKIFNRWGEVVFETRDKNKGWNGMYLGAESSSAVFIYMLEYKENGSNQIQSMKGSFVLVR